MTNKTNPTTLPEEYRFDLRGLLDRLHISQREASKRTGLSPNAISVLCGEPTRVSISTINGLCRGLGVGLEDLFTTD